jgi:hypothetical protein
MFYNEKQRCRLYPVDSLTRGEKFNTFFNNIIKSKNDKDIIVDYQYHKNADLWIDHHFNHDFGDCIVQNEKVYYNPKSPSATSLVKSFFDPDCNIFDTLLKDVDIIDSCAYKSVDQIFKDARAIMQLRAYLEQNYLDDMIYCRIVEMIDTCDMDIDDAMYRLRIGSYYIREVFKRAIKIKNSMIISKKISITNQKVIKQFPTYSEYLINPEIKYTIRLTNIGNGNIKFSVGYNQWHEEKNEFNLGKLVQLNYIPVSGGHFGIGAGVVKETDLDKFIDYISKILNEEDDNMEKYAVDKNDMIEKEAEKLVKTGEVKNMSEARFAVLNSKPISDDLEDSSERSGKDQ